VSPGKVEISQSHQRSRRTHLLKATREHLNIIDAFQGFGCRQLLAVGDPSKSASRARPLISALDRSYRKLSLIARFVQQRR
jgi:hypothetical protein